MNGVVVELCTLSPRDGGDADRVVQAGASTPQILDREQEATAERWSWLVCVHSRSHLTGDPMDTTTLLGMLP